MRTAEETATYDDGAFCLMTANVVLRGGMFDEMRDGEPVSISRKQDPAQSSDINSTMTFRTTGL